MWRGSRIHGMQRDVSRSTWRHRENSRTEQQQQWQHPGKLERLITFFYFYCPTLRLSIYNSLSLFWQLYICLFCFLFFYIGMSCFERDKFVNVLMCKGNKYEINMRVWRRILYIMRVSHFYLILWDSLIDFKLLLIFNKNVKNSKRFNYITFTFNIIAWNCSEHNLAKELFY